MLWLAATGNLWNNTVSFSVKNIVNNNIITNINTIIITIITILLITLLQLNNDKFYNVNHYNRIIIALQLDSNTFL